MKKRKGNCSGRRVFRGEERKGTKLFTPSKFRVGYSLYRLVRKAGWIAIGRDAEG